MHRQRRKDGVRTEQSKTVSGWHIGPRRRVCWTTHFSKLQERKTFVTSVVLLSYVTRCQTWGYSKIPKFFKISKLPSNTLEVLRKILEVNLANCLQAARDSLNDGAGLTNNLTDVLVDPDKTICHLMTGVLDVWAELFEELDAARVKQGLDAIESRIDLSL
jgi:hypothetical protein